MLKPFAILTVCLATLAPGNSLAQSATTAIVVNSGPPSACTSICLDGSAHGNVTSSGGASSISITLNNIALHDLITCQAIYDGGQTLTHIADTLNGTFTNDNGPTKQTFEQEFMVMSSFPNSAAGNDTITITLGANSFFSLSCQAWKNVIQTSPVDGTAVAKCSNGSCSTNSSSTVANATTNTATLSSASTDLEIAVVAFGSATAMAGSGFAMIDTDSSNAMYPEYVVNSVPTSASWVNSADNWITMLVAYKHK
jgi:hypothetical protein